MGTTIAVFFKHSLEDSVWERKHNIRSRTIAFAVFHLQTNYSKDGKSRSRQPRTTFDLWHPVLERCIRDEMPHHLTLPRTTLASAAASRCQTLRISSRDTCSVIQTVDGLACSNGSRSSPARPGLDRPLPDWASIPAASDRAADVVRRVTCVFLIECLPTAFDSVKVVFLAWLGLIVVPTIHS